MNPEDYSRIMKLPTEERESQVAKEREKAFDEGTRANEILAYLSKYFEQESLNHFVAFSSLPLDASLSQYQTVRHSLNAIQVLEADLRGKIKKANRLAKETKSVSNLVNV